MFSSSWGVNEERGVDDHGGNVEKDSVDNQDESDGQNVCWNLAGIDSIGHNLHPALKSRHLET